MSLFRFSLLRKRFKYPLIMGFFYFLEQLFFLCYISKVKKDGEKIIFSPIYHPYILVWLRFIVQMFGIIPQLIQRTLSKSAKKQTLIQLNQTENEQKFQVRFTWKILLILIGLSFTESTSNAFGVIFDNFPYSLFKICSQTLLIIFTSLICVKFLKYEYFKHHNLSIVLIFCASVIYAIVDTLEDNGSLKSSSILYIFEVIIVLIMRGSQECIEKWLMDKKYLSPYLIMSIEGLSGFIFTSLSFPVYAVTSCFPKEKVYHCEGEQVEHFIPTMKTIFSESWYIIFLILYMVSNYFFVIFKFLTNKSLSPSHRSISDILGLFCIWVLRVLILEKALNLKTITASSTPGSGKGKIPVIAVNIIKLIAYLAMIFAMLIFLEILILPCCNLEANTDYQIDSRSFKERESLNNLLELEKKRTTDNEQNENKEEESTDEVEIPPNNLFID